MNSFLPMIKLSGDFKNEYSFINNAFSLNTLDDTSGAIFFLGDCWSLELLFGESNLSFLLIEELPLKLA